MTMAGCASGSAAPAARTSRRRRRLRLMPPFISSATSPAARSRRHFWPTGTSAQLLGFSEQWTAGDAAAPFRYGGCAGPVSLPPALGAAIEAACHAIAAALGLVGLNSLDLLVDGERFHIIEVNPRPGATLDIFDGLGGVALWRLHLDAVAGRLPSAAAGAAAEARAAAIVYAADRIAIPRGDDVAGLDRRPRQCRHASSTAASRYARCARGRRRLWRRVPLPRAAGRGCSRNSPRIGILTPERLRHLGQGESDHANATAATQRKPALRAARRRAAARRRCAAAWRDTRCVGRHAGRRRHRGSRRHRGGAPHRRDLPRRPRSSHRRRCRQRIWPWCVTVHAADPVLACLGSQYAGWSLKHEKFFALGSGPGAQPGR